MVSIEMKIDKLSQRTRSIQQLLSPLRKQNVLIACQILHRQFMGSRVIAAFDGAAQNTSDFNTLYFRTSVPQIRGQYYEFWKPTNKQGKLCLVRAYLNIFLTNRETHNFEKLVSIHCDPYEDGDERISLYKRGPHLHVQKAEHPIPRCHFPLNFSELDKILLSVDNITDALRNAIRIIQDEVFARYDNI